MALSEVVAEVGIRGLCGGHFYFHVGAVEDLLFHFQLLLRGSKLNPSQSIQSESPWKANTVLTIDCYSSLLI